MSLAKLEETAKAIIKRVAEIKLKFWSLYEMNRFYKRWLLKHFSKSCRPISVAVSQLVDLPRAEFFEAPSERDLRGHDFKLRHRRKAAFSMRLPISWNKLPMEIVNSSTLDTFKRVLDLAWIFLFPSLLWLTCSLNFYFTWLEAPNRAVVLDQFEIETIRIRILALGLNGGGAFKFGCVFQQL